MFRKSSGKYNYSIYWKKIHVSVDRAVPTRVVQGSTVRFPCYFSTFALVDLFIRSFHILQQAQKH